MPDPLLLITILLLLILCVCIITLIKTGRQKGIESLELKLEKQLAAAFEKNIKEQHASQNILKDGLHQNQEKLHKELHQFSEQVQKQIKSSISDLRQILEGKLDDMNDKVEQRLKTGLEKSNETFQNIITRLAKIDEAQKNLSSLSGNIISLQDILTDKKSRGTFGEVQLKQILHSAFGDKNDKIYQCQYKLSNGTLADSILFAPEPLGKLAIDSKFPLENYKRAVDAKLSAQEKLAANKLFKNDLKKHIDDIASKYIIAGETANQAILFLPAEAIFAEVHAYHSDIIEYAQSRQVWLSSPTTLMAMLSTLQIILRNLEREKYADIIQEQLLQLKQEFDRYATRWNKLAKDINSVQKDVEEVRITSEKIGKRFQSISNVDDSIKTLL